MKAFHNKDGKPVLMRMVSGIKENKDYLGEIDGLIGDGDHGMNMNKGFSLFQQRFEKETFDLSEGLRELGMILLNEIGGSMGPIYVYSYFYLLEVQNEQTKQTEKMRLQFQICTRCWIRRKRSWKSLLEQEQEIKR